MKIKHLLFASAAAIATLAGCSKDNAGGGEVGADKDYDLYVEMGVEPASRAATDHVNTGDLTVFSKGAIFFVKNDADKTILRTAIISDDSQAGTITADELREGYLFRDVHKDATQIYSWVTTISV